MREKGARGEEGYPFVGHALPFFVFSSSEIREIAQRTEHNTLIHQWHQSPTSDAHEADAHEADANEADAMMEMQWMNVLE
jgi:hypothetical protein